MAETPAGRTPSGIALCLAVLLLAACGGAEEPEPPAASAPPRLVLLYAPCTVNKSYLSPYTEAIPFTPHLARFASEGVTFERHQTEAGSSGIAYASIFSGSQADHHRVFRHPQRLHDDLTLIFEPFVAAGYETFFWGGHPMAGVKLNFGQGATRRARKPLRANDPLLAKILERLRSDPTFKALLVTNFTVTHSPYESGKVADRFREAFPERWNGAPEEFDRYLSFYYQRHGRLAWNFPVAVKELWPEARLDELAALLDVLYEANVHRLDRLFGNLVETVRRAGLLDESLVVFTADHGEVLYREDAVFPWSHSMGLDAEVVAVPLIARGAGLAPGRYPGVSRSIDVLPTLLGLAGVAAPPGSGIQGVDLSPALRGEVPPPDLVAYSHNTVPVRSVFKQMYDPKHADGWGEARRFFPSEDPRLMWVALREGDAFYKLRNLDGEQWGVQAFDLSESPRELRDVFDPEKAEHRAAREKLERYKAKLVASYLGPGGERLLPADEEAEKLRGLGYIQ